MKRTLGTLLLGAACLVGGRVEAAPYSPDELQLRVVFYLGADLGLPVNSTFNPRSFDGFAFINQINTGSVGFGRYRSGVNVPEVVVDSTAVPLEHRTVAPFRGAYSATYMLGSGGAGVSTLSRYEFNGANRVSVEAPESQLVEGFDWVDADTIIFTSYASGNRDRLYLADVVAEPFAVQLNTAWNSDGYIVTGVTTRIRNVRVGDRYPGYAYYGDAGNNEYPGFYALNLATGAETMLGDAGPLTGSGSFGVWTVLERGGYLYVQTTDNGIQVYTMTSATAIGELYAEYTKEDLDALTGYTGQYYGLDVSADATVLILGAGQGKVFELGPPRLSITSAGSDVVLSWPDAVTAVAIESASNLSPANFTDLDPQPEVVPNEKANTVTLPRGSGPAFYRLRRVP